MSAAVIGGDVGYNDGQGENITERVQSNRASSIHVHICVE